jgi:hypothetical protein
MGEILLTSKLKGERLELAAAGSWTAAHAGERPKPRKPRKCRST